MSCFKIRSHGAAAAAFFLPQQLDYIVTNEVIHIVRLRHSNCRITATENEFRNPFSAAVDVVAILVRMTLLEK